jgi:hypothetical protein
MRAISLSVTWSKLQQAGDKAPRLTASLGFGAKLDEQSFAIGFVGDRKPIEFAYDDPVEFQRLDEEIIAVTKEMLDKVRAQVRQR